MNGLQLPAQILVGTHHKTGTVWMQSIFKAIARAFGLQFFNGPAADLADHHHIFFEMHSRFGARLRGADYRGLHVVRDPRDVIVSGMYYHRKSAEAWLHEPRDDLDGRTYQQAINAQDSIEDMLRFEMDHAGRSTIEDMTAWDYDNPRFFEVRYEDLIEDTGLMRFHEIFLFLGFPGAAIPGCLQLAWKNSLFSGNLQPSLHRRSGKSGQWREHFTPQLIRHFNERFGDALERLGYEHCDGVGGTS